jgi:xanthine dehydrogenase accessory factor
MSPPYNQSHPRLIIHRICQLLSEGQVAALATVIEAPSGVGEKLLVDASGTTVGSVGDPEVDHLIQKYASTFLLSRDQARIFKLNQLAPDSANAPDITILFERVEPEPRIVVCGAGHVGAALSRLACKTGYRVTLLDDRPEFVSRERFPDQNVELVFASDWAEGVEIAVGNGRGVSVAVVTRGHNEDEACMRALISCDVDYLGLIGSKRRTDIVLNRLRQAGADEEKLKRVRAPIGLDIGAVTPEEVALSILAEIVAERRGGKGGSLSRWRRHGGEK